jgi:hypothetical protein
LLFTWHSFRSGVAFALRAAGAPDRVLLALLRWRSKSSIPGYGRFSFETASSWLDQASITELLLVPMDYGGPCHRLAPSCLEQPEQCLHLSLWRGNCVLRCSTHLLDPMLLIGVSDITESRTELLLGQWTTVAHVTGWLQAASNSQNSARTYHVAEQWLSTVPHAPSGPHAANRRIGYYSCPHFLVPAAKEVVN